MIEICGPKMLLPYNRKYLILTYSCRYLLNKCFNGYNLLFANLHILFEALCIILPYYCMSEELGVSLDDTTALYYQWLFTFGRGLKPAGLESPMCLTCLIVPYFMPEKIVSHRYWTI